MVKDDRVSTSQPTDNKCCSTKLANEIHEQRMHELQLRCNYNNGDVSWYGLGLQHIFKVDFLLCIQKLMLFSSCCNSTKLRSSLWLYRQRLQSQYQGPLAGP
ncbi:hypothetical protein Hdeb2414_s0024g00646931 [Helianthus debilis subsp. tardiflorus]